MHVSVIRLVLVVLAERENLFRHLGLAFAGCSRQLLDCLAISVAGIEFHPGIGIGRIEPQDAIDMAKPLE